MTVNRSLQLAAIALFLAFAFAQIAAYAFGMRARAFENRELTEFPQIDWRAYSENETPDALAAYLRDRLPLRAGLVAAHNRAVFELFRESPVRDVRLGKDGWWFLTRTIELEPCSPEADPERLFDMFWDFADAAREAGKKPLVVLSPDKAETYPEFLSDRDRARYEACAEPRRALLEQYANTTHDFLNLWKPLREEKQRLLALPPGALERARLRYLYRPGDRHWHFETGRLHAREIVEALSPGRFDRVPQPELQKKYVAMRSELSRRYLQFEQYEHYAVLGDLPKALTLERDARLGPEHVIRRYRLDDERADPRNLLVVHDSFIYMSYPFIASSFRSVTFVHWATVTKYRKKARELLRDADVIVLQSVDSSRGAHDGGFMRITKILGEMTAYERRLHRQSPNERAPNAAGAPE